MYIVFKLHADVHNNRWVLYQQHSDGFTTDYSCFEGAENAILLHGNACERYLIVPKQELGNVCTSEREVVKSVSYDHLHTKPR